MEKRPDDPGQLLGYERFVGEAVLHVSIEAAMHRRHDHGNTKRRNVPLDRRTTRPDSVIVAQPVKQKKRLMLASG
jgi:hypothetical protein